MVIDLAGDSDAVVYARRDKRSWPKAQTNMLRAQVSRMGTSRRLLHARRVGNGFLDYGRDQTA
jgi:hypothetical protein